MWSPDLLAIERAHVLHLALWGALSFLLGTALAVALWKRRARARLATFFGIHMGVWGLGELGFAAIRWHRLAERDYSAALQLGVHLRLAMVGEVWVVAGGIVLLGLGGILLRRLALSGAGIAWMTHGIVLLLLDRALLMHLTRGG